MSTKGSAPPAWEESEADELAHRQQLKEARLLAEAARPLDPWERYRALVDAIEEGVNVLEIADRKARFALVVMTALNLGFFFVVTRPELSGAVPENLRPWLGGALLLYAVVAVFFFLEAVEALRPRHIRLHAAGPPEGLPNDASGLRHFEEIVRRDVGSYQRAWSEVRFDELNAELAAQSHALARVNLEKHAALHRLYGGLRVLTVLAAALVGLLGYSLLLQPARPGASAHRLGSPVRVPLASVREPSGIAWHASRRHLFVVGDEGTLAELDAAGAVLGLWRLSGNLEDVTVVEGDRRLLLLDERGSALVEFDPGAGVEGRRLRLDPASLAGYAGADANQGFEGITLWPGGPPGGTRLVLVHQSQPALAVVAALEGDASRGFDAVRLVARWPLAPHEDLTAVSWADALERLLVVADGGRSLLVVTPAGHVESELALPSGRHEGLCLDGDGALWLADDHGGLLRVEGALPRLRRELSAVARERWPRAPLWARGPGGPP